jgi:prepilin-type N-terminal cleavage/methylation domain-containing protein
MKSDWPNSNGFTIVEILVTIVVGSIVIMSLNLVVTNYIHLAQRGRYLNLANSYAEGEIEALRNEGYNSLALGTTSLTSQLPTQLPPSRASSMTISSPQNGLKEIYITISYHDQGTSQTYHYTTYVGELGVGQ